MERILNTHLIQIMDILFVWRFFKFRNNYVMKTTKHIPNLMLYLNLVNVIMETIKIFKGNLGNIVENKINTHNLRKWKWSHKLKAWEMKLNMKTNP